MDTFASVKGAEKDSLNVVMLNCTIVVLETCDRNPAKLVNIILCNP